MIKKILFVVLCLSSIQIQCTERKLENYNNQSLIITKKEGLDQKTFSKWQSIIEDIYKESGEENALWAKSLYESLDNKSLTVIANYYNNFIFKQKSKGSQRLIDILKVMNIFKKS